VIVTALRRACGVVLAVASTARPIPADVTTRDVEILTDDGAKIELYPSLTTTAHPCGL
jgi:hypothetical protein